jgi:hypothetical protein
MAIGPSIIRVVGQSVHTVQHESLILPELEHGFGQRAIVGAIYTGC